MAKVTIDGTEVEVQEGLNVIEAAKAADVHVPHFCYHPSLTVVGQCRMCLVEVEGMPKLQAGCSTTVKDGIRWRVAVRDVVEPAKSAGLMKTDILVAIDDIDIVDAAQLKNYLIERTNPGQQVRIKVRRGDVDLTFPVTLAGG